MKIGIWLGEYSPQAGGAYTLIETIKQQILACRQTKHEYLFLFADPRSPSTMEIDTFTYVNLYTPKTYLVQRLFRRLKKTKSRPILDVAAEKCGIDLFWFVFPMKAQLSYPYIYTIWDLGHREVPFFPEVSRTGWIWDEREDCYNAMVFKASYVITGNEAGKREIITNYPVPPSKVRVVPFPVAGFCYGDESKPTIPLPDRFFFYPAQFWPHKNHIRILQALKILRDEHGKEFNVVFTGSDKGNKQYIIDAITKYGLEESVIFPGFVSDSELKYLYRHA